MSEEDQVLEILAAIAGDSVLTVSETKSFAEVGGVIGLVNQRTKVRIQINVAAVESSGLQISSRLLRLADIVDGDHVRGN